MHYSTYVQLHNYIYAQTSQTRVLGVITDLYVKKIVHRVLWAVIKQWRTCIYSKPSKKVEN